jgi:hypothetical protein
MAIMRMALDATAEDELTEFETAEEPRTTSASAASYTSCTSSEFERLMADSRLTSPPNSADYLPTVERDCSGILPSTPVRPCPFDKDQAA